jgi:hypothetical protein
MTSIAKITDHRYDPEDGTVLQFLQNELGYMRKKKTELEGMLKEADANYDYSSRKPTTLVVG